MNASYLRSAADKDETCFYVSVLLLPFALGKNDGRFRLGKGDVFFPYDIQKQPRDYQHHVGVFQTRF